MGKFIKFIINLELNIAMKLKHGLDEKDLKILEILQSDGRASYSQISRDLGMSEAAIYSRIQKLLKSGEAQISWASPSQPS